jgi:hypothetical protein
MEQEQFVGFDVSQAETSVCVVDGAGKVVWQGECASTPEAMAAIVKRRMPPGSLSDRPHVRLALPQLDGPGFTHGLRRHASCQGGTGATHRSCRRAIRKRIRKGTRGFPAPCGRNETA